MADINLSAVIFLIWEGEEIFPPPPFPTSYHGLKRLSLPPPQCDVFSAAGSSDFPRSPDHVVEKKSLKKERKWHKIGPKNVGQLVSRNRAGFFGLMRSNVCVFKLPFHLWLHTLSQLGFVNSRKAIICSLHNHSRLKQRNVVYIFSMGITL